MYKIFLVLLSTFLALSFHSDAIINEVSNIEFVQNGNSKVVKTTDHEITLKKQEFQIHYYNKEANYESKKYYSTFIAAVPSSKYFENVQTGMTTSQIEFFAPGSGLAGNEDGYDYLFINDYGNHYLVYEEGIVSRVKKIGETKGYSKLSFLVKTITDDTENVKSFEETAINELHLIIFRDTNSNAIVDRDELHKITVKLID